MMTPCVVETTVEMIVVRGEIARPDDPMHRPHVTNAIMKRLPVSELPATVTRWLELGRKISSVSEC